MTVVYKALALDAADQANFTDADLENWKAKGVQFINLYVKWSTPKLVQMIFKHGMGIVPVVESTQGRALAGYSAGVTDAKAYLASIKSKLGASPPSQVAVAWTDDEDTLASNQAKVVDYGRGWKDGLAGANRTIVYGNGAIAKACKASGYVDFEWVMGGSGTRGTTDERSHSDMYQEVGDKENLGGGHDIDSDVELNPDMSWIWWPDGDARANPPNAPVNPIPIPPVITTPDINALIKQKVIELQNLLKNAHIYNGPVDGDPGPLTQAALVKWRI